jgi:DNA-binding GntR family transcriptional regulator
MPEDTAPDARPRYAQLSDILRDRIESGRHPVGSLLPTENDLCAEFGVSRHTVREALRLLTEARLILRRQGSGSQVIATRAHEGYVHAMRSLAELFQYAADTRLELSDTTIGQPGDDYAGDLGLLAQDDWLIVRGLRHEQDGGVPICATTVFVNRAFASIGPDLPHLPGAIYTHIESRYGVEVALVEQDIRVIPIPPEATAPLHQKSRANVVRVTRRYLDDSGRILLASVNLHPSDRFFYSMRLRREGPKGGWS